MLSCFSLTRRSNYERRCQHVCWPAVKRSLTIAGNESRNGFALNSYCQRREVAGSRPAQAPLINAQHHRTCYPQEPCILWFSQISLCPSVMMR